MNRISSILESLGIEALSPMQKEMLQVTSQSVDIQLLSPTGSGKTLAYLLPLVLQLDTTVDSLQALVVVPSRELAQQSSSVLKQMRVPVKTLCLYGGRPAMDEHRQLRDVLPQLVFATPGRLCDHIDKCNIDLSHVSLLVIDEFDKCLEMGFEKDMRCIVESLSKRRQTWLLSATAPDKMVDFVCLNSTVTLDYTEENPARNNRIETLLVPSPVPDKLETLARILSVLKEKSAIVFVAHRESVERVGDFLKKCGFIAEMYHGGMEQQRRERAVFRFRSGGSNILVSTDLAARGLDIPHVDTVIHYHLPIDEAAYIHRCGRTARWDSSGSTYVILGPKEELPGYVKYEQTQMVDDVRIFPARPQWCTLYIGRGKKDKLSKGDIVGFFCKKGGLKASDINHIHVGIHHAYVSIVRSSLKSALQAVSGEKIKAMKTIIEEMAE